MTPPAWATIRSIVFICVLAVVLGRLDACASAWLKS